MTRPHKAQAINELENIGWRFACISRFDGQPFRFMSFTNENDPRTLILEIGVNDVVVGVKWN